MIRGEIIKCISCGNPRRVYNKPFPDRCITCYFKIHTRSIKERLLEKVKKTNYCWNWTGRRCPKGYALMSEGRAHRFSYSVFNGPIPRGLYVLHRCDNRACVNPEHLFLGTQLDNMRDCKIKGRNVKGEKIWKAKLKENDIFCIRNNYRLGEGRKMADMYHISTTHLYRIIRRDSWAHL